jgi:twitching motility protein PilU
MELNFAISLSGVGRFRVNLYRQRSAMAMVIRYVKTDIPSIEELRLPEILHKLILEPRGLILVVGATGSGKSTALASMIDHRNRTKHGHILTVEEPIEFLHAHHKSIVDQREIGFDTLNYANALKNAMRAAPDVIMIGEIREYETMKHAVAYAETGHLCISTLHANNANQAIDRIINFFPEPAHKQLYKDLELNLLAVISLRLIPAKDGGRVPAVEIMLKTPYISELISRGDIDSLKDTIEQGEHDGMQTFDQSLYKLCKEGKITEEMAMEYADSRSNLGMKFRFGGDQA